MKQNYISLLKDILAMSPFILNAILVIIATINEVNIPASTVAVSTATACAISSNSLSRLRKKAVVSIQATIKKYSRKDDYFAFYNSIFEQFKQITNCQDYLNKSEELFTQKNPFIGKKIDIYYERGTLHTKQKSKKEFEELSRSTVQNNFSTWKKTKEI